jgi:hypothetical protein
LFDDGDGKITTENVKKEKVVIGRSLGKGVFHSF